MPTFYRVVDVPCPKCQHIVYEFVGILRATPAMSCVHCGHWFDAEKPPAADPSGGMTDISIQSDHSV